MKNNFALELPINSLSFGQTSTLLLRSLYERGINPCIFPIGNPDLSAQTGLTQEFANWLKQNIETAPERHNRNNPIFKLWHINGSLSSYSKKQNLFTFHETSQLTDSEINILNSQDKVLVSSNYTKQIFETFGVNNVEYCPLAFDKYNFYKIEKRQEDTISFGLQGKFEQRKQSGKIAQLWVKKFGNNKKYRLNLAIYNPFLRKNDGSQVNFEEFKAWFIQTVFGGVNYWNVNFLPFMASNAEYNNYLNYNDVDLTGLSLCEGFNLPLFHSLCLGKNAVVFNSHVHKDYCNDKNSILVKENGVIDAHDGMFFIKGLKFNQGYWAKWNDDEVILAMEIAANRAKTLNIEGETLKEIYTVDRFTDSILKNLV